MTITAEQINAMSQYYCGKYGTPKDDGDAVYKLALAYQDLFNEKATTQIKEGLAEYYRTLSGRDLSAYVWILESLHVTSKKEKDKRNFPYVVGMLRNWMKCGFGHIPNQEEDELIEYFEEVTGHAVSYKARQVLQTLMGKYGVIKITRMISELKDGSLDKALVFMLQLQTLMDGKFEVPLPMTEEVHNVFQLRA